MILLLTKLIKHKNSHKMTNKTPNSNMYRFFKYMNWYYMFIIRFFRIVWFDVGNFNYILLCLHARVFHCVSSVNLNKNIIRVKLGVDLASRSSLEGRLVASLLSSIQRATTLVVIHQGRKCTPVEFTPSLNGKSICWLLLECFFPFDYFACFQLSNKTIRCFVLLRMRSMFYLFLYLQFLQLTQNPITAVITITIAISISKISISCVHWNGTLIKAHKRPRWTEGYQRPTEVLLISLGRTHTDTYVRREFGGFKGINSFLTQHQRRAIGGHGWMGAPIRRSSSAASAHKWDSAGSSLLYFVNTS